MAAPASHLFPNPQSQFPNLQSASAWTFHWPCNSQLCRGFSLLDLLITLLVLTLVLLAAVSQFSNYQKSEIPPAAPAQSVPAQQ